jgi:LytTr DNA-binding domain
MIGPQGVTPIDAGVRTSTGMRVVLFDRDDESCARIRAAVERDYGFVLVGACREWPACEVLLDRFVPELLIANVTHVPPKYLEKLSASDFPVLVGLREDNDPLGDLSEMYDSLRVRSEPERICSLLRRVQFEIYKRKADELSSLLQRYMACATRSQQYLSWLKIGDEEQTQHIPVEQVLLIAADGNYVRVHADGRTYEIRETMTGISAKLDPSRFARVHRSFIVNLSYVRDLVTKETSAAFVRLNDGMEVPVGPNYRQDFERAIQMRDRWSA